MKNEAWKQLKKENSEKAKNPDVYFANDSC